MRKNIRLVALVAILLCGTGVFAQKSVQIIKPNPEYGGFTIQFKVIQVKGMKYSLTYQYSGVQSFPIPFALRTDSLKQDTLKTDSVFKYTFIQSNSNMPDPGTSFWLRIRMSDSAGIYYYSDTVFIQTWAVAKMPWMDTLQTPQNNNGTIEGFLKFYSNVPGKLETYVKFGNGTNIFAPTNFTGDTIVNLVSLDSTGLITPKISGIPSGTVTYIGYKFSNFDGAYTYTIGSMKVMPYITGNQKPAGSIDSLYVINKKIRVRVKGIFFNSPGTVKLWHGPSSGSYTDTLSRQSASGIGTEYFVFEIDNPQGNTTRYIKVLLESAKGTTELLRSIKIDPDPIATTLWVDTAYGINMDMNAKTMTIQIKGSFSLGSGISSGEIWARVSRNPNFSLPYTSNSYFTTSTSGMTGLLTINSPMEWDTTQVWYAEIIMRNTSTNELTRSNNYKVVYQPRPTPFSGSISGIQSDKGSGTAIITVSYINTLQTTSTWKTSIGLKSDLSDGIVSTEVIGTSDYGNIKFPVSNLVSGVTYYIRATGTNTVGKTFTTTIQNFTLGTNTGIGEIQKPTLILYPNPVNDVFTISIPNKENYVFELFNMSGKLVLSKDIQDEALISRDGLPSGIYFYKVGTTTGKLVFN